jgi:hypothetical protein
LTKREICARSSNAFWINSSVVKRCHLAPIAKSAVVQEGSRPSWSAGLNSNPFGPSTLWRISDAAELECVTVACRYGFRSGPASNS